MTRRLCQVNLYPITTEQGPLDQIFYNGVDGCCTLRAQPVDAKEPRDGRRKGFLEYSKLILNEIQNSERDFLWRDLLDRPLNAICGHPERFQFVPRNEIEG